MSKTLITSIIIVIVFVVAMIFFTKNKPETSMSDTNSNDATSENVSGNGDAQQSEQNTNTAPRITKLTTETITPGTGAEAKVGDTVSMNYTGTLTTGMVFDSNVDPKFNHVQPFEFQLGSHMVIEGWEQGILGMKVGEKRKLMIPAAMAYGDQARGSIPADADLMFEVELLAIK